MSSIGSLRRLPVPLYDSILCQLRAIVPSRSRSFSATSQRRATVSLEALDASKGDRERIVILGSGWAGKAQLSLNNWVQLAHATQATTSPRSSPPNTRP